MCTATCTATCGQNADKCGQVRTSVGQVGGQNADRCGQVGRQVGGQVGGQVVGNLSDTFDNVFLSNRRKVIIN